MNTKKRTLLLFVTVAGWLGVTSTARLAAEIIYWPLTALDQAKQRAESVDCVHNLRRIVVVAQLWANDNGDTYPSNFQTFAEDLTWASLPSETVFCPANHSHPAATNWVNFDWSRVDYEWMPQPNWLDPGAVCCRCLVHSNVAYVDGHVERRSGYRSGWPAIIAAPLGQVATPGSDVQFQVAIAPDATMPVGYQWRREQLSCVTNVTFVTNGGYWTTNWRADFTVSVLEGQTNSTLLLSNVQTNDSDYYSVLVSNRLGAAVSNPASLFVDPAVWPATTNEHWSAINCLNNLHQIALFGQLWAGDHNDRMPPSLPVMTNACGLPMFGWPVVLFCRSDQARPVPPDWAGVNLADTSYEVFPVEAEDFEAVFCRCKFHGYYVRMDGIAVFQPSFTRIRPLTNNALELAFTVFRGPANLLEVSTDLVHWTVLRTYAGTNGDFQLLETNNVPQRFYRIRTE